MMFKFSYDVGPKNVFIGTHSVVYTGWDSGWESGPPRRQVHWVCHLAASRSGFHLEDLEEEVRSARLFKCPVDLVSTRDCAT